MQDTELEVPTILSSDWECDCGWTPKDTPDLPVQLIGNVVTCSYCDKKTNLPPVVIGTSTEYLTMNIKDDSAPDIRTDGLSVSDHDVTKTTLEDISCLPDVLHTRNWSIDFLGPNFTDREREKLGILITSVSWDRVQKKLGFELISTVCTDLETVLDREWESNSICIRSYTSDGSLIQRYVFSGIRPLSISSKRTLGFDPAKVWVLLWFDTLVTRRQD